MKYPQIEKIKEKNPVIQSITNPVTINDCANILLAVGASPIMAHHEKEVAEIQAKASALVLNLGATDDYESMMIAAKTARECGHPIVLDPVGVGVSTYRRQFALRLIEEVGVSCIRCNYGEAMILASGEGSASMDGLDSRLVIENEADRAGFCRSLQNFSDANEIIIAASGPVDFVISKDNAFEIASGHEMMRRVTGMGCMCSEVVAAFLAVDDSVASVKNALEFYGECGKLAGDRASSQGTMTFKNEFINTISCF